MLTSCAPEARPIVLGSARGQVPSWLPGQEGVLAGVGLNQVITVFSTSTLLAFGTGHLCMVVCGGEDCPVPCVLFSSSLGLYA